MRKSRAGDTESRTNGNFGREERILRIAVLIKQVPAVDTVKIDEKTGTMIRDGVEAELNPLDLHAVEAAVRLKESRPAGEVEITAVTMGPPAALKAVRYAIAMGCDKGLLLSDRKFGGADTLATARTLSRALLAAGPFDLLLAGERATDGETGQVGPACAELMGVTVLSYVSAIDELTDERIRVTRAVEGGHETVEAPLPAIVIPVKEMNKAAREGRRDTVADGGRPSHGRLGDWAFRLRDAGRARDVSEGDAPGTQDKLSRGAGIRDRRDDEGSRR